MFFVTCKWLLLERFKNMKNLKNIKIKINMAISKEQKAAAKDLVSLVSSLDLSYLTPLANQRLPSKIALLYIQEEVSRSKEAIKPLNLPQFGENGEKFVRSYDLFDLAVKEYNQVESRDLAQSLGPGKETLDLPDTDDVQELMLYLAKQNIKALAKKNESSFLTFVESLRKLALEYGYIARSSELFSIVPESTFPEKTLIGSPLRKDVIDVISAMDQYSLEATRTMSHFLKASNHLIEMCRLENFPYY